MSEELKKNTAREWFNTQKDVRWHFSEEQEQLIDRLLKVFESEEELKEASIDYPRPTLSLDIWDEEGTEYTIKPEVKQRILDVLSKYEDIDLIENSSEIRIVGSLCSNLYVDDTDVDIHLVFETLPENPEEIQRAIFRWFKENRDTINGWNGDHPIEIFLQLIPDQDLISVGVYDLIGEKWKKGPKIVPEDYDPYSDFSDVLDTVREIASGVDKVLGELKRDVIDFDTMRKALEYLSDEQKIKLQKNLESKLDEIESDIESLLKSKKGWHELRRGASLNLTPETAKSDTELSRKWKNANATFKLLNRYLYLRTISELEKLISDENISPEDVNIMKGIVGL